MGLEIIPKVIVSFVLKFENGRGSHKTIEQRRYVMRGGRIKLKDYEKYK